MDFTLDWVVANLRTKFDLELIFIFPFFFKQEYCNRVLQHEWNAAYPLTFLDSITKTRVMPEKHSFMVIVFDLDGEMISSTSN